MPVVWYRTTPSLWDVSYCWGPDSPEACFDHVLPKSSSDHGIPRMTWWDHKGTSEWIERRFAQPTPVSTSGVYWFDDTGRGSCRVPKSWRLLYRDGDVWKPVVNAGDYGTLKDRFNRVKFTPVTTTALRLEVQLQPKFSAGVLEWEME